MRPIYPSRNACCMMYQEEINKTRFDMLNYYYGLNIEIVHYFANASTVAQTASFLDIFVQNGKFLHILAKVEKMCVNMAKIASMPQVYIHNESFEPNL